MQALNQAEHVAVYVLAIRENFFEAGTREQSAERAVRVRSELLVIGVEEEREIVVEEAVAGQILVQKEGFEKPSGVCEMPPGGAGVGHGLDHHVFAGEPRTEVGRGMPDASVAVFYGLERVLQGPSCCHRCSHGISDNESLLTTLLWIRPGSTGYKTYLAKRARTARRTSSVVTPYTTCPARARACTLAG